MSLDLHILIIINFFFIITIFYISLASITHIFIPIIPIIVI